MDGKIEVNQVDEIKLIAKPLLHCQRHSDKISILLASSSSSSS